KGSPAMPQVQVLYWHDIPAQVRVRDGRDRVSLALPIRFQEAIDNAAMAAGITGSDAYTDGYHWEDAGERAGSANDVAAEVAAELDTAYAVIDWRNTADQLRSR
ncbi:MAG: virulence factor, partial [Anaerolineae bacterium]|nr:virulence factor [Anaerolineae bacterium]